MSSQRSNSVCSSSSGSSTTILNTPSTSTATESVVTNASQTRRKRIQCRSCDQCRASKRACDLSTSTISACSTCTTRQIKCTTEWLGGRKKHRRAVPPADTLNTASTSSNSLTPPSPSIDFSMVSSAIAEHVKGCKLRIYTTIFELPYSHWLAPGCNPFLPCFVLDDTDLAETELARCIQLTSGAYDQIKIASTFTSKLVHQFSLLDGLLLSHQLQQKGSRIDDIAAPRLRAIRERNKLIDEALTWTAVANAFQYTANADFAAASGAQRAEARSRSRSLTTAAWQQARKALFANVSFHSFRSAFAFLIFGITTPPTMQLASHSSPAEDTAFAIAHGLKMMSILCQQAKAFLESSSSSNRPTNNMAVQALKATMWFNEISKAILKPVVKGLLADDATASLSFSTDLLVPSDDLSLVHNPAFVRNLFEDENAVDPLLVEILPVESSIDQVVQDPWTRVIHQARAGLMSSAIVSFKLDAWAEGRPIELRHELNEAAGYKVLIWKAVADLESVSNSSVAVDVAIAISKQWHASHALVIDSALAAYDRLDSESRTMLSFAVHHSSLGLFYLDSIASKLASNDMKRLQDWQAVDPENLASAQRVAQLCARARQDALGGFTMTADEAQNEGARDLAQTLPLGQWCHPFPPLVLQAQAWAAHHLLRHAESHSIITDRTQEWMQMVDHCLFCIEMMRECLAPFPAHALDQMPFEGLLERRAYFLSA